MLVVIKMISKIKKYNFIDNIEYAYVLEDTTINSIEDTMKVYVPKLMVGCTIDKSNINLNTIINKKDFDKLIHKKKEDVKLQTSFFTTN